MILGTAGHIDHGKTALVRTLTGVDTDRLPEEKRRGITIDLGFAPLPLADGTVVGVVDVPGHEAFVRTMLAGATGIDVALLVIAADEGPMPQTREHLAILELLGVKRCVVALTKRDLVEAEWLGLVTEEIRTLLKPTPFASAPIIATSVVSGDGIPELRSALVAESRVTSPESRAVDLFRLPVDRAFSVKGTGTVVTGTVWSGTLAVDSMVRIMPLGTTARVRTLQNHGASVKTITPGMRAAIALAGIEPHVAGRGATLVTSVAWESTLVLRADLTLLPGAPALRPRTRVRLHLATSDVGARVVASGTPVEPGTQRTVRVVLDEPIMARGGDRFVLRSASPLATIGGGIVTDSNAPRRARPMPALGMSADARFELFVTEAGGRGHADAALPVRLRLNGGPLTSAQRAARVADRWYAADVVGAARAAVLKAVQAHHEQQPLATGLPREDIRSRLGLHASLFEAVVAQLVRDGQLAAAGADLRSADWKPAMSEAQRKLSDQIVAALELGGAEPPSVTELETKFGKGTIALLRHLEREKLVIQVEEARYYAPKPLRDLVSKLESLMAGKGELAPTDLREGLGFSRKFLIPFLEYCDRRGLTARQGNGRVWRGGR